MPSDDEKIQTVKVEIVTPKDESRPNPVDVVKQFVDQRVAEILANRDDFLFQPFLQTRRVSDEISRMQTVPEQKKWSFYFDRWGCLICGTKSEVHCSCGMCTTCHNRIFQRLQTILKAAGRRSETSKFEVQNDKEIAKRALLAAPPVPRMSRQKRGAK